MLIFGLGRVGTGGGGTAPPVSATTFTVSLSASTGAVGLTQTATVTPGSGGWPSGETVALVVSGAACAVSPDSRVGSGSTPVAFSFTPSAAGTLTVNAVASGMTSTGAKTYTVTAAPVLPSPSTTAVRYLTFLSKSAAAPGGAVSGSLVPIGTWPAGTSNTITLAPSSGSGATITLPNGGNSVVSFSVTAGSAAEISVSTTNSAGMLVGYPAPLSVFSASTGTARTLAANVQRKNGRAAVDYEPFQLDTFSGAPAGFPSGFTKGWAEVWVNVTAISGTTGGLFARLYDGTSSGATSTAGTGTELTSGAVQVYGPVSAASVVRLLLPGSLCEGVSLDLATDAAFTNPVRCATRIRIGWIAGLWKRSQECGVLRQYADDRTAIPAGTPLLVSDAASDPRYPGSEQWHVNTDTIGGREYARILEAQLGVTVSFTGLAATGGGLDKTLAHDGTLLPSFANTVADTCDGKMGFLDFSTGNWDGDDSNYPTETYAEDVTRITAAVPKALTAYPCVQAWRWLHGAPTGWFGSDGSADMGYTRLTVQIIRALEQANPCIIDGSNTLWNEFYGSHATYIARLDYVRTAARMVLATLPTAVGGLGTSARGPTFGATAARSGQVIRVPYTLGGGASLTSVRAAYTSPTVTYGLGTASSAELAALFAVYVGPNGRKGTGQAIQITSAAINTSSPPSGADGTIDLTLAGSGGIIYADGTTAATPSQMTVHYAADYGVSNTARAPYDGTGVSLCDNRGDYSLPYGWLARPAIDIAVS